MRLDVIVPTYERPRPLRRAFDALLRAAVPDELTARIIVVQNDSNHETAEVIRDFACRFPARVIHMHERRRGKSHALNAALTVASGDLIGFIDDDEEIDPDWYHAVADAFRDRQIDFIGGPCLPRWGAVPPVWLPEPQWRGVIGFVDDGNRRMVFGKDAPGILMGGNAVLRREVLERVGWYSTALGPTPRRRLLSGEDRHLYERLLDSGAHGVYIPALKIYHYVPPERLTKRYYRHWTFWNGVSSGFIHRGSPQVHVPYVAGVPRHVYGSAVRGLVSALNFRHESAERFSGELSVWHLAGFVYGCHWYRPALRHAKI